MSAKLGGATTKCQACQKTVYPLEAVNVADAVFHKRCFKCRTPARACRAAAV